MRSLFKDKDEGALGGGYSTTQDTVSYNTPQKVTKNADAPVSTPPITPESDVDSPVTCRAVSSPSGDHHNDSDTISSGTTSDMSTALTSIGLGGNNLLQQVLGIAEEYGRNCGKLDDVAPINMKNTLGLVTIPEDKAVTAASNEWGTCPSKDGNEEEEVLEESPHEDFELVLEDEYDCDDEPVFCQPCEGVIAVDGSTFNEKGKKNIKFWKRKDKIPSSSDNSKSRNTSSKKKLKLKPLTFFRHKKKRSSDQKKDSVKPPPRKSKIGKWKPAICPNTQKVYFYHTKTREVTWNRPEGFFEWKVAKDKDKVYFYNSITKETTWDMPKDFQQWREVTDTTTDEGKKYYYNVLTRETTWNKPDELIQLDKDEAEEKEEEKTNIQLLQELVLGGPDTQQDEVIAKEEFTARDEPNASPSTSTSDNSLSRQSESVESQVDELTEIVISDPETRLHTLLSHYCPDEKIGNEQLLRLCKGNEAVVLKGLESVIEDSPYDEIGIAVLSYVKNTIQSLVQAPMDELKMAGKKVTSFKLPPATDSTKGMNRVNTFSSTYSMTSRALSHVTNKSVLTNVTEATNRVNNTSTRAIKKGSAFEPIEEGTYDPNHSFDDGFDTETDASNSNAKVELDLKAVLGENIVSKKAEILNDKRKEENEMRLKMDMKVEQVKNKLSASRKAQNHEISNLPPNKQVSSQIELRDEGRKSTYAADREEGFDHGTWQDHGDDVSELSDSFSPAKSKRAAKEKKRAAEAKSKGTSIVVQGAQHVLNQTEPPRKQMSKQSNFSAPIASEYVSIAPPSPQGSVEYVELSRVHRQKTGVDENSVSSWDEDTITTTDSR